MEPETPPYVSAVTGGPSGSSDYTRHVIVGTPPMSDTLVTGTTPDGATFEAVVDNYLGVVAYDEVDGETWRFEHDVYGRLTAVIAPELNRVIYTLDGRGNITEARARSKNNGASGADIVASATYDTVCTDPKKCNKPNTVTDARSKVTNYTYHASTGALETVTLPANADGVRAQTRYAYSPLSAWYKNSAGAIATAATSISKLTGTSVCNTGVAPDGASPGCVGSGDETLTILGYGTGSSSAANNLLPLTSTVQSGDGVLSATTTTTYNSVGTVRTVDGPLTGATDTTRYHYDIGRQLLGQVGPDPDGGGPLRFRAIRTSYNVDGQPTQIEQGYVDGQSDGDWTGFVSLQASINEYDADGRKWAEKRVSGGVVHALTQYSYDLRNRIECAAVRMNPSLFASPPGSACALGTQGIGVNDFGPDRITKNLYVGRQRQKIQSALGTGLQQDTRSMTYTSNGRLYTLTDAKGNRTTYEYDGFDRLKRTRYPSPSTVNTSSTTDYEELDYDAASNVISTRLRDGQTIYYTPDNLNRTTLKNLPGSELDVSYSYDHANRMLSASTSASTLQWVFDALGRLESEASSSGAVRYRYDAAGRRERLTWPDGLWVSYAYDASNALSAIREYGATSGAGVLATFSYDNLGQRKTLTRGNGTTTSYDYDGASRLSSLAHDLSDSGDTSSSFTYSPSSQLRTLTRSNSNYNWTATNTSQSYSPDGLNRYSSVDGVALGYDGRGNLTSYAGSSYAYSAENRLLSASGATAGTLSYDPSGR
ncbi:RHS repeat domain-containing protein, partial [Steroidobacter sp.]|uniref:RHS repeat domain-containing protein n=1 Tax=Steroidobacter sp. TaxID=1978227 RepID=UPI0025E5C2D8